MAVAPIRVLRKVFGLLRALLILYKNAVGTSGVVGASSLPAARSTLLPEVGGSA